VTGMIMRRPHYMKINMHGERFQDESIPITEEFGWMSCVSLDYQPGKVCWTIIDQKRLDDLIAGKDVMPPRYESASMIDNPPVDYPQLAMDKGKDPWAWRERIMDHMEYEQQAGRVKVCQTLQEVADWVGCDATALTQSVERYNLACRRRYDEDFLKAPEYLLPCEAPPYYVLIGKSGIDTCLGGLKVDHRQRVMRLDGHTIPGLWGAGVLCSGWFSHYYCFFGSEMSYTIYSGRTAGAEAAAYCG